MARALRRHVPGQFYLVTTRCHQARYLLRPDPEVNDAVLEWLTRAQIAFPHVKLHAVCVMSNHLHLVVHDQNAELSKWAGYLAGNLARAVNRIRGRSGHFYGDRYAAEPILDHDALLDRIAYVVTNPVKARLCKRVDQWPGVLLWAQDGRPLHHDVSWIDRKAWRRTFARRQQQLPTCQGRLRIDPLPTLEEGSTDLAEMIHAREETLAAQRRAERKATMTRAKLLAQPWHDAPPHPKRSPRPVCHASDPNLHRAFTEAFREFTTLFREASERLRTGLQAVTFPHGAYPPGQPLRRIEHLPAT